MFNNNFLFGEQLFAQSSSGASQAISGEAFSFNGFGLQNAHITTTLADYDSPPERNHQLNKIARADGAVRAQTNYYVKKVAIKGVLSYSTLAATEEALSEFKRKMVEIEKNLDIIVNGERRRYVATVQNTDTMIQRGRTDITRIPFDLQFVCKTPFGLDTEYQIQTEYGYTALINPSTVDNVGEATARPIYIFSIAAATGITGLEIENETTEETITIDESVVAGDVLRIDVEEMTVTLNGDNINYTGVFPFLATGNNSLVIRWTGTSVEYTFDIKYKKTYL